MAAIERPKLRGWVHFACALAAPFALVGLILAARSPTGYVGAAIFGAGLVLLFSVSSAYHLLPWRERARRVVGRIDHSTIFVAIAAFYTPFCLGTLSLAWGIPLLAVVWTLAAAGIALKVGWPRAPRPVGVGAYLAVGWLALVGGYPLSRALPVEAVVAIVGAGLLYSAGALAYATRWPNPAPRYFGHHEVFHVCVAAASVVLYGVVAFEVVGG